jgi:cell division protein FtsW
MFNRAKQDVINILWFRLDKGILFPIAILYTLGLILVISTSPYIATRLNLSDYHFIINHFIFIIVGFFIMLLIAWLDTNHLIKLIFYVFIVSLFSILYVIFFETNIKGASRWISLFGFSLQPSEFTKVTFPFIIAFIWKLFYKKMNNFYLYCIIFFVYAVVLALFLSEPDIGMSILITLTLGYQMIIAGMSIILILLLSIGLVFTLITFYYSFNHFAFRIDSFFSEKQSYQTAKAINAIQNGKLFGLGSGNGSAKIYLPDSHTDFIFSVLLEEWGLIFTIIVLALNIFLLSKILFFSQQSKDIFVFLGLNGAFAILVFQIFIHISSNLSLIPTKGMTFPFISYGGSSLISMAFLIGIILSLTKKQKNF